MNKRELARCCRERCGSLEKCPIFRVPKATCPPKWNADVFTEADFYSYCETGGIRVYTDLVIEQRGLAMVYRGVPRIFISKTLRGVYRHHVVLHELGHTLLHARYDCISHTKRQRELAEIQADVFAACGMIPRPLLERCQPKEIAAQYDYPLALIRFRQEIAERWQI